MTDFRDLVGDDLSPEEEERLRRVHELLVAAGPPPELPPELERLPAKGRRQPRSWPQFPLLPPRRFAAAFVVALGCLALAFGIGVLVGDKGDEYHATTIAMHPPAGASKTAVASIQVADADAAGNWPLVLHVSGLPQQKPGASYELWLTKDGKRLQSCGSFRVYGKQTVVHMNAPWPLKKFDGWIVTTDDHAQVLLTT
jgi:hypothetical protein